MRTNHRRQSTKAECPTGKNALFTHQRTRWWGKRRKTYYNRNPLFNGPFKPSKISQRLFIQPCFTLSLKIKKQKNTTASLFSHEWRHYKNPLSPTVLIPNISPENVHWSSLLEWLLTQECRGEKDSETQVPWSCQNWGGHTQEAGWSFGWQFVGWIDQLPMQATSLRESVDGAGRSDRVKQAILWPCGFWIISQPPCC